MDGQKRLIAQLTPMRRAEHRFVVLSFAIMTLTGLAQRYYTMPWAAWILEFLGGADGTRRIHHFAGVVSFVHLVVHLGAIFWGLFRNKLGLSLLPVPQDFRHFAHAWRYRFGLTQELPRLPTLNYQHKFQYLGLVLGSCVMMVSGMILLFPHSAILLVPGHVIPSARLAHCEDGLFAYLLLVGWHVYAVALSPTRILEARLKT